MGTAQTRGWDGMGWHGMGLAGWQQASAVSASVSCALCDCVTRGAPPSVGLDGLANPGCCGWRPVRQAT